MRKVAIIALALTLAACSTYPQTPEDRAGIYLDLAVKEAAVKNMGDALLYFNIAVDEPGQEARVRTMLDENPGLQQVLANETVARLSETKTPDGLQHAAERANKMATAGIMTAAETQAILNAVKTHAQAVNQSGEIPFLLHSKMKGLGLLESPEQMQIIVTRTIKEESRARHRGLAQAIFAYAADPNIPAKQKQEIQDAFDLLYVQADDLPFASAVFPKQAKRREAFLLKVGDLAKDTYIVRQSVWNGLPEKAREQITRDYRINLRPDADYGVVMDVQTVDRSTAGSNAGSVIGSGVAQIAYVDRSFSNMNYSPWAQVGFGLLGAIVGSAANTAPVEQYQHFYTIRRGNGELTKTDQTLNSPDRMAPGTCLQIDGFTQAPQRICEETSIRLESFLLGSSLPQRNPD